MLTPFFETDSYNSAREFSIFGLGNTCGIELRRLSVGDKGTLWKTFSLSVPLRPLGRLPMMASETKLLCKLLWLSKLPLRALCTYIFLIHMIASS